MRYSITLSYDGSAYCGWQIQPRDTTVQETLQTALSKLLGHDIQVTGAGRTDSKVNAINYVAHFDCPEGVVSEDLLGYKLNAILPRTMVVHQVKAVSDDFHARFAATERQYAYFIHRKKDPFAEKFSFQCTFPLDVEAMNRAAAMLLGRHDFSCFEKVGADNKTSICTVTRAEWVTYRPSHVDIMGFPAGEDDYLVFHISADRFLRNMVRAVVGTLIEVGRGRRTPESMEQLLSSHDRCSAGESVPGNALFLSKVSY